MDREQVKHRADWLWAADDAGRSMSGKEKLKAARLDVRVLLDHIETQQRRIEELETELQKKSGFLHAAAKTLFSERRDREELWQEVNAHRAALIQDAFDELGLDGD